MGMALPIYRRLSNLWSRSVTNRLTAITLLVFLLASLALSLVLTRMLRQDMERVLAAQQLSATRMAAETLDREVLDRLDALDQVATQVAPHMARKGGAVQAALDASPALQRHFSGGGYITDARGIARAEWPQGSGRMGLDYSDRDYVKQALATGRPAVGTPVTGRALGVPVLPMAVPISNAQGETVGVMAGVIDLYLADFLHNFHGINFGETGNYLVVDTRTRRVVSATDRRRLMEALPSPGEVESVDRLMSGAMRTQTTHNRTGAEVLVTGWPVPSANWLVAISVPKAAAFQPALELERRLLGGIATLGLVGALISWLLVRRQLRPLDKAARELERVGEDVRAGRPGSPLAVARPDEVGHLIHTFNELLTQIGRQQAALAHSEMLYSTAFQLSPDAVSISRLSDATCLQVNQSFTRMFGWTPAEIVGRSTLSVGMWRSRTDRQRLLDCLQVNGRADNVEAELMTRDGRALTVLISASVMELKGERCLLAITHDITARRQAQRQIETLAFSDPLTGLPNRRLLTDRLGQALVDAQRKGEHAALLFVDLDDFKQLNDSQGHTAGDKLLRAVAMELRSAVRLTDAVARLGGDEFVVLARDLPSDPTQAQARALAIASQLGEAVTRAADRLGNGFHATVSIGVALAGPARIDSQEMMRHADLAMYRAKEAGRGQVRLFTQDMLDNLSSRAALEADLRVALARGQFQLHYQPQVDRQGRVVGAEALLRWNRPDHGPVSPAVFVPLAENSGLILPLGRWVLETACRQLATWARSPARAGLTLSVNVSSRQFQQPGFVDEVQQVLLATGADPHRLRLELTETVLVDSFDAVASRMQALKALGVGFSLDDFGTGFSSLAYLKRLPLDELKIDASFVRDIESDPNDLAIAQMVVALAGTLGLQVLAEGVEREAQREQLARIGCDHYQGYLFGRPQPIEEFNALVAEPLMGA